MHSYHTDKPKIPGRPLACCTFCKHLARLRLKRPKDWVCGRCGLTGSQYNTIHRVKAFVQFEDLAGNVVTRIRRT